MNKELSFDLKLGVLNGSQVLKHVSLLRANGVAEKVFLDRSSNQHEWAARVICVSVASLGGVPIAAEWRKEYLANGVATEIHPLVLKLPLQEANVILLEIHRRLWKDILKNQISVCTACGKEFETDIDMNKLDYTNSAKKQIEEVTDDMEWFKLDVDLPNGFEIEPLSKSDLYSEFVGLIVSRFIFRTPTLGDAIRYANSEDEIEFWRSIAYDCLTTMYAKDENGSVELPIEIKGIYGKDRLFNLLLDAQDLSNIRIVLRDALPTIDFGYKDTCPCPRKQLTSISVPLVSFFAD